MAESIDFKKYRYFHNYGIIRMDRETKKLEHFIHGRFVETVFKTDIEVRAHDGFDDLSELEDIPRSIRLLKEELGIE